MEKILTSVVTIALTFTVSFAHEAESNFTQPISNPSVTYNSTCTDYVDANYDGFCDNCSRCHSALSSECTGYVDADNDGFCDNHTYGEHCPYFPANTPNDSANTTLENNSRGHHRNSNHHSHGHH